MKNDLKKQLVAEYSDINETLMSGVIYYLLHPKLFGAKLTLQEEATETLREEHPTKEPSDEDIKQTMYEMALDAGRKLCGNNDNLKQIQTIVESVLKVREKRMLKKRKRDDPTSASDEKPPATPPSMDMM